MPSRIIRVSVLNKIPVALNVSSAWDKGNGKEHFENLLIYKQNPNQYLDYATSSSLIGRNATDTLSFRLLFEETTNVYGHVKNWFEIEAVQGQEQQQAYTEEELAYIETQNNWIFI
eukprot:TRINITY_DN4693_c0_g1_i1.p1 TRINITY_DN4693_c0_g1~~TRINITY_DN4693_c0_g1_i1.p1  ORF type:complete len:116 (-),score=19.79 TRINITY_DN4693_c0_g1_i1:45-392(-)